MRNLLVASSTAVLCCGLAACAIGPDYREPIAPVSDDFIAAPQALAAAEVRAEFWTLFNDATLNELMRLALAENKDLDIARANLRASRAALRLVGFDAYPTVTARADHFHRLRSEHELPGVDRDAREGDDVDAGFDASWEIDLFGRVRRGREAARATEQAAVAQYRDVQVSVTAEVARNYFVLRGLQNQLAVNSRNADNQSQTLRITRARLDAGRGTELDTSRAEAQLQTTLAGIPPLRAAVATTMYRLAVLTGREPSALLATLDPAQSLPVLPALTGIGTPAALLRRRPDVRAAERNLAAATARIGIAVGDLFPRVTLLGSGGFVADSVGRLGDPGTDAYSFGPAISWAALDLGRVRARIGVARAQTDGALASYEAAVLNALEDTNAALVSYRHAQDRRELLEQAAVASTRAANLARQRFEGGLADFLNVLNAERDALTLEDSLAQSRTQTATSLIALYKALGGGWIE
jgi:multidrug efflux system outer membrane protein